LNSSYILVTPGKIGISTSSPLGEFHLYAKPFRSSARGDLRGTLQDGNGMRYLRAGVVTPPRATPGATVRGVRPRKRCCIWLGKAPTALRLACHRPNPNERPQHMQGEQAYPARGMDRVLVGMMP